MFFNTNICKITKLLGIMKQKRYIFLLFIIFLLSTIVNAQYFDSFSDGNLSNNPNWTGNLSHFEIRNGRLHLNNINAEGSYIKSFIVTSSQSAYPAHWQGDFIIETQPTSGNLIRFYLIASNADLSQNLNGYFVEIGGKNKVIRLVKQTGKQYTTLCSSDKNVLDLSTFPIFHKSKVELHVEVERSKEDIWTLSYHFLYETKQVIIQSNPSSAYKKSNYSGVFFRYSKTHAEDYWVDNLKVSGEWQNEEDPDNPDHPAIHSCKRHDLVVSEILFDPTPPVALPNEEYIEFYNRSDQSIALDKCYLRVGTKVKCLKHIIFPKQSYVVFQGKELPTLTNTGSTIALYDADSVSVITWSDYAPKWISSTEKRSGGWSLEKIDLSNLDQYKSNWKASVSTQGGTPGTRNSVAQICPDKRRPHLEKWKILSKDTLVLYFNKELLDLSSQKHCSVVLKNNKVIKMFCEPIKHKVLYIKTTDNINEDILKIHHLSAISHYLLDTTLAISLPETPQKGDLILNEILPKASVDGAEFVELYNSSTKALDLSKVGLSLMESSGELKKVYPIASHGAVLMPKHYAVVTSNVQALKCQHKIAGNAVILETPTPILPDHAGGIALVLHRSIRVDSLNYVEDWYPPQLAEHSGISLERQYPTSHLWSSASCKVGYATAGSKNSNYLEPVESLNTCFKFREKHFSPNQDGYQDRALLNYALPSGSWVVTISIYTMNGVKVYTWLDSEILTGEGVLQWDGSQSNGTLVGIAPYVIVIEAEGGKSIQEKHVVVRI